MLLRRMKKALCKNEHAWDSPIEFALVIASLGMPSTALLCVGLMIHPAISLVIIGLLFWAGFKMKWL